jgi:hypothetical protein
MERRNFTVSPATPIPLKFDPEKRLKTLRELLDPESPKYYRPEGQHRNIKAVILAYEQGQIQEGDCTFFKGGRMVSPEEGVPTNDFVWTEVLAPRIGQGIVFKATDNITGDGNQTSAGEQSNNILTIFDIDIRSLRLTQPDLGFTHLMNVSTASGTVDELWVEIRFVHPTTLVPISSWIQELAVIRQSAGLTRLSDAGMRDGLFFSELGRGNLHVSVAHSKTSMASQL